MPTVLPEPGERWAHRRRAADAPTEVEIVKLGALNSHRRARVRFLDDEYEGREEWVTVRSLKVPWNGLANFLAGERAWADVKAMFPRGEEAVLEASYQVFAALDFSMLPRTPSEGGMLCLYLDDPDKMSDQFDEAWFRSQAHSIETPGEIVVPWPAPRDVAMVLSKEHPSPVLDRLRTREAEWDAGLIYGTYRDGWDGQQIRFPPERCRELLHEMLPSHSIVREWCGAEARAEFDELEALRAELPKVRAFAVDLGDALRHVGAGRKLGYLQRRHGLKIDELRQDHQTLMRTPPLPDEDA